MLTGKKALLVALMLVTAAQTAVAAFNLALPPMQESMAFKQFSRQPKSELAKLNYLLTRFQEAEAQVVYDGHHYEVDEAIRLAKTFLYKRYNREPADYWVKKYCYKTDHGNVILFKTEDGTTNPMRELVLDELVRLNESIKK